MIVERIAHFIDQYHLLERKGRYLVALSGGADSVALLLVLKQLGYNVEAVHCNFNLRGAESHRDEDFCVSLCHHEQVELHRVHFDTLTYAAQHKMSIETAARELRYRYFENLRKDICADGVCVAHHRDDQVETVLMHILRGCGLQGLTGMAPRNGAVIRPMLCVTRGEIEMWLNKQSQAYVIDSTNHKPDATRNKLRLQVIPLLKEINTCASENIALLSERMLEVEKVVNAAVRPMTDILIDQVLSQPSPLYTLYVSLSDKGFNYAQLRQILAALPHGVGREWRSASHQLVIDRHRIVVEPLSELPKPTRIPETGTYVIDDDRRIRVEMFDKTADFQLLKDSNIAFLDADCVFFPLKVRVVEQGDRFFPLGMKGSKLLSDYLTDQKLSLFDKRRQLVVEDARGQIVWVVNKRPSERCRITPMTVRILRLSLA